jgi:hypothetical protein
MDKIKISQILRNNQMKRLKKINKKSKKTNLKKSKNNNKILIELQAKNKKN